MPRLYTLTLVATWYNQAQIKKLGQSAVYIYYIYTSVSPPDQNNIELRSPTYQKYLELHVVITTQFTLIHLFVG